MCSTFDDTGQLLHVVMCFPVVNHSGDREDQFGLDLRKSVEDTLRERKEREGGVLQKHKFTITALHSQTWSCLIKRFIYIRGARAVL